ncbi:hypothetical protein CY35_05G086300 [Sphagnum magellanicum]|nr:hypothetical protein CY35_05G086300 [Sphagnum magellanicum]
MANTWTVFVQRGYWTINSWSSSNCKMKAPQILWRREQKPVNFKKVDAHVHQFKGSSSSIGAKRVKAVCIMLHMCCDRQDQQGCLLALEHVKREFDLIKGKLQTMLELEKQIVALGGTPPFMDR